jgi:pimeloyl-ACP methyl ester carboxylesterase
MRLRKEKAGDMEESGMIEPHSSFVDAEAVRLHYLEWNPEVLQSTSTPSLEPLASARIDDASDTIPLVLLHGLGATADTWRLVATELCQQHQVIALDLRGHGLSDQPDSGYDMQTIAEDTVGAMAALGLGQVALVGHGWGARIALVLAARHPALISHLILVDCPHIEPRHWPGMTRELFIREHPSPDMYTSRATYLHTLRREMSAFWSPVIESIVLTYVRNGADGRVEERLRPENQRHIREALWEDRALAYYGKLACPVLLVPAADQPQPGEEPPERLENPDEFAAAKGYIAAQVARTIPHCTVLWMPNTVHDIQLQRPQVLAEAILSFVKE